MKGELLALAAMLMFASNTILTRVASARLAMNVGYLIVIIVNIVFAALLFTIQQLARSDALHWDSRGVLLFALAGVFSTWLGRWFVMESIARLGPAKTSAFQVSSPLFTLVFALAFLGERLSAMAMLAMLLTAAGLLLVSLSSVRPAVIPESDPVPAQRALAGRIARFKTGARSLVRSTAAIALASSAAYAVGNVLRGAAIRQWNEPILGALVGALAGIVLHFAFNSDRAGLVRSLPGANRRGVLLFGLCGVLTICAQVCMIVAMAHAPVAVVALITLCTPLVVFPLSYFLLKNDEGINTRTILGGALTLAGVALITLM